MDRRASELVELIGTLNEESFTRGGMETVRLLREAAHCARATADTLDLRVRAHNAAVGQR